MATLVTVKKMDLPLAGPTRMLVLNCLVDKFSTLTHHRELETVAKRHLALRIENSRVQFRNRRILRALPEPFSNTAAGPYGIEQIPGGRL